MSQKEKLLKLFMRFLFLVFLNLILLHVFMQEAITKYIMGFIVVAVIVIIIRKGLENNVLRDIFAIFLVDAASILIDFFSDIPFIYKATEIYTKIAQSMCLMIGKDMDENISGELSVTITIVLILFVLEVRDYNVMKYLRRSKEEEPKEKNFTEKSEMFCKTLRQRLEAINRETDLNEEQFIPLEAEVEMNSKGKRKKKYEDLIKCLKNSRRHGTVYLVLGTPGSGKSVSMRKLCLNLLKESKKTKKIPVYINLKEWNEEWNLDHMPEKNDLIIFIRKTLEAKADCSTKTFLDEYFQRMFDDGRWYFIFDSFDEMPCLMGKRNCQELIDGISALLYQFMTGPNQSGGVVASRLYKAPSSTMGATVVLKIQEFSDIKIKAVLKKNLNHYEDAIKLLFGRREDLVSLCRNPFYLTLLTNYFTDKDSILPENQMELYHSFIVERLKKCAGKLEKEGLDESEIYQAAKELALFMHETKECGLECPTRLLYQRGNEAYLQKVFALLNYAKICRLGGQDETISFVHHRFQEFFLVENIIDQKQIIGYENYRDILSDAGMRDALVLYCEVAEEEKAKEIANFCWKTIQANIKFAYTICTKESQELVCVMYFMKEAFRNRKQVLSDFKDDFYQLAEKIINGTAINGIPIDDVVTLALANAMVLFSNKQLNNLVLMAFEMNNCWLNDVIVQNCRTLDMLEYHIENEFVRYFGRMDIKIFLRRFSNMQFSLSVSEKFRYVRKMHIMTLLMDIIYALMTILLGTSVIVNLYEYFFTKGIPQINILQDMFLLDGFNIKNNMMNLPYLEIALLIIAYIAISLFLMSTERFFGLKGLIILSECLLNLRFPVNNKLLIIEIVQVVISMMVIVTILLLLYIHALKFYIRNKKNKKIDLKNIVHELLNVGLCLLLIYGVIILLSVFRKIIIIMCLVISIVLFVGIFCFNMFFVYYYLKDCLWIRKHSIEIKHMQRIQLESNLNSICLNSMKYKYLELLLLQNIELTDMWPDYIRPQYGDERANYALAKLDCIKLEFSDYLF